MAADYGWQETTLSPRAPLDAGDAELGSACGRRDGALEQVAAWLAGRERPGSAPPDVAEIAFALRRHGSPYVWPRAWVLEGSNARANAEQRLQDWLASFSPQGERRCGVVTLQREAGGEVVVALASDVLADLEPLPTVVPSGTWIEVNAKLLVPASSVKVVVLAPRGRPYPVPSGQDGERVRARVRLDQSGPWLVQVLGSVAGGPRPIAEALVFADVPPSDYAEASAPGEDAAAPNAEATEALLAMVNRARQSEGSGALVRDPKLDRLADEHARAMRDAGRIAHDLGNGNPADRVQAAGVRVKATGENLAHAATPARAHRALWASPSHRENLLLARFDAVGIGVAVDEDGSVWVCELFADLP